MATEKEIFEGLVKRNAGELTDDRIRQLRETAKTLASLEPPAPKPDPKAAAQARLAELQANPLPRHATDAQKIARAREHEAVLAVIHPSLGQRQNLEAFSEPFMFNPPDPEAA